MWRKNTAQCTFCNQSTGSTHAQHCFSLTVCVCVGEGACTDESWVVDLSLVTLRHRLLSAVTQSQLPEELLLIGRGCQKNISLIDMNTNASKINKSVRPKNLDTRSEV